MILGLEGWNTNDFPSLVDMLGSSDGPRHGFGEDYLNVWSI